MDQPFDYQHPLEYAEAVHELAAMIPAGAVLSYKDIAELLGSAGPRQVGQAMHGAPAGTPWWRVIKSDGTLAPALAGQASQQWLREQLPMRGSRVDMPKARWQPGQEHWQRILALAAMLESGKVSESNDGIVP